MQPRPSLDRSARLQHRRHQARDLRPTDIDKLKFTAVLIARLATKIDDAERERPDVERRLRSAD